MEKKKDVLVRLGSDKYPADLDQIRAVAGKPEAPKDEPKPAEGKPFENSLPENEMIKHEIDALRETCAELSKINKVGSYHFKIIPAEKNIHLVMTIPHLSGETEKEMAIAAAHVLSKTMGDIFSQPLKEAKDKTIACPLDTIKQMKEDIETLEMIKMHENDYDTLMRLKENVEKIRPSVGWIRRGELSIDWGEQWDVSLSSLFSHYSKKYTEAEDHNAKLVVWNDFRDNLVAIIGTNRMKEFTSNPAWMTELKIALEEIIDISNNSHGIAGWHQNGDLLGWDDIDCMTAIDKIYKMLEEKPKTEETTTSNSPMRLWIDSNPEAIEDAAKAIYELMPYEEARGEKPKWAERGNSIKQDEARRYARAAFDAPVKVIRDIKNTSRLIDAVHEVLQLSQEREDGIFTPIHLYNELKHAHESAACAQDCVSTDAAVDKLVKIKANAGANHQTIFSYIRWHNNEKFIVSVRKQTNEETPNDNPDNRYCPCAVCSQYMVRTHGKAYEPDGYLCLKDVPGCDMPEFHSYYALEENARFWAIKQGGRYEARFSHPDIMGKELEERARKITGYSDKVSGRSAMSECLDRLEHFMRDATAVSGISVVDDLNEIADCFMMEGKEPEAEEIRKLASKITIVDEPSKWATAFIGKRETINHPIENLSSFAKKDLIAALLKSLGVELTTRIKESEQGEFWAEPMKVGDRPQYKLYQRGPKFHDGDIPLMSQYGHPFWLLTLSDGDGNFHETVDFITRAMNYMHSAKPDYYIYDDNGQLDISFKEQPGWTPVCRVY